jgi:hypothetical protein
VRPARQAVGPLLMLLLCLLLLEGLLLEPLLAG